MSISDINTYIALKNTLSSQVAANASYSHNFRNINIYLSPTSHNNIEYTNINSIRYCFFMYDTR